MQGGCGDHTERRPSTQQALPRAGSLSRDPLVGSWGVRENVTCGLAMDMLWNLAGLRILCLEIALSGSGSRTRVPDCPLAGTRAQGPRVGRRPRGQLPWRDTSASSLTQLLPCAVLCFPTSLCQPKLLPHLWIPASSREIKLVSILCYLLAPACFFASWSAA